jgi:transposase
MSGQFDPSAKSPVVRSVRFEPLAVPAGKIIHAIADNYGTHKHPKVKEWLADHPRWVFHFTPTSASWMNAVEGFFSTITRKRTRRGAFKSVSDLQDAIRRYIREHNKAAKPFVWTKPAETVQNLAPKLCLGLHALFSMRGLERCSFHIGRSTRSRQPESPARHSGRNMMPLGSVLLKHCNVLSRL